MGFANSAEVTNYIGGIFETAFEDDEIGPKLVDTGLVVAFDFTDPEAVVVIDMANKSVREGLAGGSAPTATMSMTADTGNGDREGKGNMPRAPAQEKDQGRRQRGEPAQAGSARQEALSRLYRATQERRSRRPARLKVCFRAP